MIDQQLLRKDLAEVAKKLATRKFNLDTEKFDDTKKIINRKEVEWRRNHIAIAIGSIMFIHGGIDDNGKLMSDYWILDFTNYKWYKLETKGIPPPALAHHCCTIAVDEEKLLGSLHIYRATLDPNRQFDKKMKLEGIYIWGGMTDNREITNELRVLRVGRRPCEWVQPNIGGKGPQGRLNAKMNFYKKLNIIILHGGRNDSLRPIVSSEFFIIDMERLVWVRVGTTDRPKERTEFESVINNEKLIILGGINSTQYNKMDLCLIDLDTYSVRKQRREFDLNDRIEQRKTVVDIRLESKKSIATVITDR